MSENKKKGPEAAVREINRQTRRKFTSEEKIRIVLEGLRDQEILARREIIKQRTLLKRKLDFELKKTANAFI